MSASGSQSGRGSSSGYFDPEAPDLSEQEFAASLDSVPDRPRFIVDAAQVSPAVAFPREPEGKEIAPPTKDGQS